MIIGGEHYIKPGHLLKRPKGYIQSLVNTFQYDYKINFTFGGYYSLLAILNEIRSQFDINSYVLLPSYLCPSILKPFKLKGIKYKFYKIDPDLFIDTQYLISILDENVKAVVFIDYFGCSQKKRIQKVLDVLKSKEINIIQDIVQCLEIRKELLYGDYIFNSFRKFFPFEGSILLSKKQINISFSKKQNRYIKYKRFGQILRFLHIRYHIFPSKYFLSVFRKAEDMYYTNEILKMPKFNFIQLNKYDIVLESSKRKKYFILLFQLLKNKVPKLLHSNNFVPLGFILKIDERDLLRTNLLKQNIFTSIHWILSDEIDRYLFHESIYLSKGIITIPLADMNDIKYQYLVQNMNNLIKI